MAGTLTEAMTPERLRGNAEQGPVMADRGLGGLGVQATDPLAEGTWDEELAAHPDRTVFHGSGWARVLVSTYGHRPCYLRVTDGNATVAMVPLMEVKSLITGRRGVSVPFADEGGMLLFDGSKAAAVRKVLEDYARKSGWSRLDLRGGAAPEGAGPAFQYLAHRLDLSPGLERVEQGLAGSVRRAIRKAGESGLEVEVSRAPEVMRDFYRLHERTRRRHGLPPQPMAFFTNIARELMASGNGEVVVARAEGRPVAGAVFLRAGAAAVYKFGASDRAAWPLRPNQLVMWEAIRHLATTGCSSLDLGRTSPSDEGLLQFKRSWGATERPAPYYRFQVSRKEWQSDGSPPKESHGALFGWMPLGVNRVAGRLLYPHLD